MIPYEDKIFVVPDAAETKTNSGLLIPDTAQERQLIGTIKGVGEGKEGVPLKLKVGDRVTYPKHVGVDHFINGERGLIMKHNEIFTYDRV